ncbi:Purple acid phosphatase 8 [Linum grandiflorum]
MMLRRPQEVASVKARRSAVCFITVWLILGVSVVAELPRVEHKYSRKEKGGGGSMAVMVVGDWGRKGDYNQSRVAYQMGKIAEEVNVDFVISTGDNFYDDGLKGVDDPAFYQSFSDIYTAPSLQKPWYNILGNHDYRGNVEAQLSTSLQDKDSRWICHRSFILNTNVAEFFFVDTTPFSDKYFDEPEDHVYDWSGLLPNRATYLSNLLRDLDSGLRASNARWKIVVGHHTIKSAGHHGNTVELEAQLLPVLEANNVDLYVNGHDHCLEHISSSRTRLQFLTSGAGSKAWKGDIRSWNADEMKLYYDGQGFMTLQISPDDVGVVYYDINGNVLHQWSTSELSLSQI